VQKQIDILGMQLSEKVQQIDQRPPQAIYGPCGDHVEVSSRYSLHQGVQAGTRVTRSSTTATASWARSRRHGAFDLLKLDGRDLHAEPLERRKSTAWGEYPRAAALSAQHPSRACLAPLCALKAGFCYASTRTASVPLPADA
jgi:hypothetical protein